MLQAKMGLAYILNKPRGLQNLWLLDTNLFNLMEMDHTKCHEPCDMTVDDESDCKWLLVVICGLFPFFQAEAGIHPWDFGHQFCHLSPHIIMAKTILQRF